MFGSTYKSIRLFDFNYESDEDKLNRISQPSGLLFYFDVVYEPMVAINEKLVEDLVLEKLFCNELQSCYDTS